MKNIYIYAAIAVVVIIVAVIIKRAMSTPKIDMDSMSQTQIPTGTTVVQPPAPTDNFPLQKGSKGDRVKSLQIAINNCGGSLTPDGDFGQKTYDQLVLKVASFNWKDNKNIYPVDSKNFIYILEKCKKK